MGCDTTAILRRLQEEALESTDRVALGRCVVEALKEELPQSSWVGIYWLEGDVLQLGPYVGPPTEHERIPVSEGICGTAVREGRDILVDDVREEEAYLACSPDVRSEIVVLIRSQGEVIGQIDVDSESVGAFDATDHCVLRSVADGLAGLLDDDGTVDASPAPEEGDARDTGS